MARAEILLLYHAVCYGRQLVIPTSPRTALSTLVQTPNRPVKRQRPKLLTRHHYALSTCLLPKDDVPQTTPMRPIQTYQILLASSGIGIGSPSRAHLAFSLNIAAERPTPSSNYTPTGLTPSDSQNESSRTSYSPHQDESGKGSTGHPKGQAGQSPTFYTFPPASERIYTGNQVSAASQDTSSTSSYVLPQLSGNNEDFTIPAGWTLGTGSTPLPTGSTPMPSGMSPPADGDWSQLLGGSVSWDNGGPEQGNVNWEADQRPSSGYAYKSGFSVASDDPRLNMMSK